MLTKGPPQPSLRADLSPQGRGIQIRLHSSIEEIGAAAWNRCFIGALEGYDYLLAAERAGIRDFQFRYLVAYEKTEDGTSKNGGTIVAATPAFFTRYHLDTTLDAGRLRRGLQRIKKIFPNFMSLKLACLGSPVTEFAEAGFHQRVADADKSEILEKMLAFFEVQAVAAHHKLLAVKDYASDLHPWWNAALTARDYASVNGLPVAHLAINFTTMDAYFATLSHATRKDMRRKLRRRDEVRTEIVTDIPPALIPRIMELYRDTHDRAEMKFEELTAEFFTDVMTRNAGRAICVLYYVGDDLLAFNLLLRDGQMLLDKFFCMEAARGREFNLYFLSWFVNIEYCLAHRISTFQSGAAGYDSKLRLGSQLYATRMAYRHANPIIHALLRLTAPLLAPDNPVENP